MKILMGRVRRIGASLAGAIAFYTILPMPVSWMMEIARASYWVPIIGLGIGAGVAGVDAGLQALGMPILTRSAIAVLFWVAITGGLHLDGAMDTADGLAVTDPERRLAVMADSQTGAFGAMVAVAILLLKTVALVDLAGSPGDRWIFLPLVAGWARWGQQVAIARYPYLKAQGKGAFHKAAIQSWSDTVPGFLVLLGLSLLPLGFLENALRLSLMLCLGGGAIALLLPAWFHHKLGGHTGDTYGAVVEWSEGILLVLLTLVR
ncbi:MAG: adenosylcobinamide-GDP ribazoletransferase [Oculatellaceae cyanobacterium Prado106]|nr:adenosylcobinamide-GDP ribazoletransferase [Oculatellaceae cyanobacterium Prado106]